MAGKEFTDEEIDSMSDKELDQALAAPATETGEPAAAPASPTPEPTATPSETPAPEPATPKPGEEGYMFAGKYKSTEDLAKGILEISKPLQLPEAAFKQVVELAKKTGDWSAAEQFYKELDGELSHRRSTTPAQPAMPPTTPPAPSQTVTPGEPPPEAVEQELGRIIARETWTQSQNLPVVVELRNMGVDVPTTEEGWRQLKMEHPAEYIELKQEMQKVYSGLWEESRAYMKAQNELPSAVSAERDNARTKINQLLGEYGVKVADDQINQILAKAEQENPFYEDRSGVRYPATDSFFRYFLVQQLPTLLPEIRAAAELRGREAHIKDLAEMHRKTIPSVAAGSRVTGPLTDVKVDLDNPDEIARLSDEELERHIRSGVKKK